MIQLIALNYIISKQDVDLLNRYNEAYFPFYVKEFKFIKEYYNTRNKLPDLLEVLDHCPAFTAIEVYKSKTDIEDDLCAEYVYNRMISIIADIKERRLGT